VRRNGIALVVADTAGKWPLLEDVAAEHVYVRLHGDKKLYESGYSDVALARWARKIKAWMAGREASEARRASSQPALSVSGRDVYVYFDNDVKTHAPFDALRLARKIRTSARRSAAVRGDAGYVTSGRAAAAEPCHRRRRSLQTGKAVTLERSEKAIYGEGLQIVAQKLL
jgi:hypothetical protein